jgi:type VI protein secretion system component VasK
MILAPLAATDSDVDANNLAAVVERDLGVLQETLAVSCPVVTLVCDLERVPGCQEFIERLPEEQRQRRLGLTFPHVAAADLGSLPTMISDGLRWLCQDLAPSLVYRTIPAPRPDAAGDLAGNTRRYQFLSQVRQREPRVGRIVARGINPGGSPWQLRGCYLAATGADAVREQAFVAGVFPSLVQLQNAVAWTPAALREDRFFRHATYAGYAAVAMFGTVTLAILLMC